MSIDRLYLTASPAAPPYSTTPLPDGRVEVRGPDGAVLGHLVPVGGRWSVYRLGAARPCWVQLRSRDRAARALLTITEQAKAARRGEWR